jgi:hypothetical protein
MRQPQPIDPRVVARRNAYAAKFLASRRSGSAARVVNRGRPTPRAGATTRTPTTRERVRRMADWCASATTTQERLQTMANAAAVICMERARYWGIRS